MLLALTLALINIAVYLYFPGKEINTFLFNKKLTIIYQ